MFIFLHICYKQVEIVDTEMFVCRVVLLTVKGTLKFVFLVSGVMSTAEDLCKSRQLRLCADSWDIQTKVYFVCFDSFSNHEELEVD